MNEITKTTKKSPSKQKPISKALSPAAIKKMVQKPQFIPILIVIMAAATLLIFKGIISTGSRALINSYNESYASDRDNAYQVQYQKYYEQAKQEYLVTNRVKLNIGDLHEVAALEVLKVSDVEYIIEDSPDNSNGITSWLEVPGNATYVVNLQAAEFIIDDSRSYVHVRVPQPELTNIEIDYINVQKLLFKNDILNDSYRVGEDLARKQLNTADMLIKKEFLSNQHFFLNAKASAVSNIQCLVRQLNPGVSGIVVEVDFY